MSKKYLVVGATGLMGTTLVNQIPLNEDVTVIARRKLDYKRPVQFLNLDEDIKLPHADHLFICLGYPLELRDLLLMRKSIKAKFKAVDYNLVIKIAEAAKQSNIKSVSVISSIEAHPKSLNYYLKVKGQMENKIKELEFESVNIFRPSHLLGEREKEITLDVKIFEFFTNIAGNFLFGWFKKYKNIHAQKLAAAMYKKSNKMSNTVDIFAFKDFS
jgi:nucleoside-diphosphate-sugar epimerase